MLQVATSHQQILRVDAPFPPKLAVLFQPKRLKVLYGGRGAGRCLGKGTKVLMVDGTLKAVEKICIGDLLMGPDSKSRKVLSVTKGVGKLYRVDQAGGGMSYTVNDRHILSLQKSHTQYYRSDRGKYADRYVYEKDIVNIPVQDWIRKSQKWKGHFFGYKAGLIKFGALEGEVGIDPYFLGMWLGDGTSRELRLTVHKDDWQIINYCRDYVEKFDLGTSVCTKVGVEAYDVGFPKRKDNYTNALWDVFKKYGLDNDKHIPEEYQIETEENRLALLAGLIDSDGYCHNNGYEFCNTNKEIAFGVKRLADFLGFKTSLRTKRPNGRDRISLAYLVSINGSTWRIPSLLPRKKIYEVDTNKNKNPLLMSITVTSIGTGEFFGFELDKDHLFILEDGTVTHNSWGCARALLILGTTRPLRVLCARELQNSIAESVHKLLADQVKALELESFYEVQADKIIGANGTTFVFAGIKNNTTKIKSYEGVDYCWVEEANKVSRASWGILLPTIRKEVKTGGVITFQSEIWMTFNPELETDYTYQRFVLQADPAQSIVQKMTYADNPWFPDVLRTEMENDKKRDYDYFLNVWEGHCLQMLEGVIYANQLRKAQEENRISKVPYDKEVTVNTYWDIGRSDATSIWFIQRVGMQYRVLDFHEESGIDDVSHFLKVCQKKSYLYGTMYLPHDAKAKHLGMKRTIEEQVRDAGYNKAIVPRQSIQDGINAARIMFNRCWFDESKCSDGLNSLRHYRYKIVDGQRSKIPHHDWASHGADAFRTFATAFEKRSDRKTVADRLRQAELAAERERPLVGDSPGLGWMR